MFYKKLVIFLILIFSLCGCATRGHLRREGAGVYHKVKKGETLWGISRVYNVELEKLVKVNRIPDAARITSGQLIYVPRPEKGVKTIIKAGPVNGFIWPVRGKVVGHFGKEKTGVPNKGIDIQTGNGTSILASKSGVVAFCSETVRGYGKIIIIDHGEGYQSVYAYNRKNLVSHGQSVTQGEVIGKVGDTGRADTPLLHFEIRKGHVPKNPFYYLP